MLKSVLKPIITLWEKGFARIETIETIEGSPYGLLRMSTHVYKGQPTTLADGTKVLPEDLIIEIHISNLTLARGYVGNIRVSRDIKLLPLFRAEMINLARLAQEGHLNPKVKALWGVTMLGPGLKRLGFELTPMEKGFKNSIIIKWMGFLRWLFSAPPSYSQSKRKTQLKAHQYWMSLDTLIQKYGYPAK